MLPNRDLRQLLYAKLDHWDRELVKLAHGPSILDDRPRFTRVFEDVRFQRWCARRGYIALLEHITHWPSKDTRELYRYAAIGGNVNVLQWLKDKGTPFPDRDSLACTEAAGGGHLSALKWLLENGSYCLGKFVFKAAARNGHLHVLQWLVANGYMMPRYIGLDAAAGGHLCVLQWLHTNDEMNYCACPNAAEHGHLHILQWAKSVCICFDRAIPDSVKIYTCTAAAHGGQLNTLQWLVENGYPIDIDSCLAPFWQVPSGVQSNCRKPSPEMVAYLESLRRTLGAKE